MKFLPFGILVLALAASPALALDSAAVVEARHALQHAVNRADVQGIFAARARFQSLAALEPQDPLPHYWSALADWRSVPLLMRDKARRRAAERQCKAGMAAVERALALDPKSAEALALKAGLLGLSLSFESMAGKMTLGPAIESDLGRALGLAPDNPRVHLFDGINTLHKPGFVGGGARKALPRLERAIVAFDQAGATDSSGYAWGRDDALVWAGRASMKLDDPAAARGYFVRALEVNPDNGWVRTALLPEAERAVAAGNGKEKR